MQTALLTDSHPSPDSQRAPLQLPQPPASLGRKAHPRNHNLESLLKTPDRLDGTTTAEAYLEPIAAPGIFLGIRVALLFNAGLGLVTLLGYEAWCLLAK